MLNTDAEGRLVLADALAYADAHLDPDLLVDLATLTGAASLGLGRGTRPSTAPTSELAAALLAAGESSGERLWRMPLVEDYRSAMDSDVADLRNTSGDPHVSGGSITAALFLREFTGGRPWAHLDIAGPARADRDEHEVTRGGTGFGARLLVRWLEAPRGPARPCLGGLDRDEQPVAGREQGAGQPLVLADRPAQLADRGRVLVPLRSGRRPGRARARCRTTTTPPGRSSRSACSR